MGGSLAYSDFGRSPAIVVSGLGEAGLHLVFCDERLDHPQTSEGLVKLGHGLAPFLLCLERTPLEFLSDCAHPPCHQRNHGQGEQGEFPAEENEGGEIADYKDRVLYQHVQRTDDGVLDLVHVSAHPGYDVTLLFLVEEAHRKAEELVIDHSPDVSHNARPERNHDCR